MVVLASAAAVALGLAVVLFKPWAGWAGIATEDSGSRQPYKHLLTLYDADGRIIDPRDPNARPYSPRMTCGQCHAYDTIACGWHFNAADPEVPAGRPGEPWLLTDALTRTQLPLSDRDWPGTFAPREVGMTPWQFMLAFGRHLPGGGLGEKFTGDGDDPDPAARWQFSGQLEADCMACHSADGRHNPADWARQIELENLKWAPTVALGLGRVRGSARDLEEEDPLAALDPAYEGPEDLPVEYDLNRFDPQRRVFFNIQRRPSSHRCYACHTTRQVGPEAPPRWHQDEDVHLAAGMTCTDCHRNDIGHMITRGYETESRDSGDPSRATLSCAGCHLGDDSVNDAALALGGRLGAPHPEHRGIPPIHFEKLSCTACHSGPWPQQSTQPVQTSMAHALGIASTTRTWQTPPYIVAPVFATGADGKIAPHRMTWPAFWGWLGADETVRPIHPQRVAEVAADLLPPVPEGKSARAAAAEAEQPAADAALEESVIESVLQRLGERLSNDEAGGGEPIYVREGMLHRLSGDALEAVAHEAAAPYLWPMGHDVRPAVQSLGARGCDDCHASDAPFYFGMVTAASGPHARPKPVEQMYELQGADPVLARAWAVAFAGRPAFKALLLLCTGVVLLVLLRYGLAGLGVALGAVADGKGRGGDGPGGL